MKRSLLAIFAFGLASLAFVDVKADLEVAQFINERVDESLSPVKRFKEKASSRIKAVKSRITASKRKNYNNTVANTKNKNSDLSPEIQQTEAYSHHVIEPEISPVQIPKQYEEDSIALWKRPSYVSQVDWIKIVESIKLASKKTGIPEQLILSLINKESGFNPRAVSRSGAIGLTQLMPNTAKTECGLSKDDLFDISANIDCGISYLDKQIKYFRKLDLAIAAYNAGPGAVRRAVEQAGTKDINAVTALLKPETKPYVFKILARINYGDDFI